MNWLLLLPLLFLFVTPIHSNPSIVLYCDFKFTNEEHKIITSQIYECENNKNPSIISPNTSIDMMLGNHTTTDLTESDVISFKVTQKSFEFFYFPIGLNIIFTNLQVLRVNNVGLREIHKRDLKGFKELRILDLHGNQIEYLDGNLFQDNEKLEFMNLSPNNIWYIDSKTFGGLKNVLMTLNLDENPCVENINKLDSIENKIKNIQDGKCNDPKNFLERNFPSIGKKYKSLENNYITLIQSQEIERTKLRNEKINLEGEIIKMQSTNSGDYQLVNQIDELKIERVKLQGEVIKLRLELVKIQKIEDQLQKENDQHRNENEELKKRELNVFKLVQEERLAKEDAIKEVQTLKSQLKNLITEFKSQKAESLQLNSEKRDQEVKMSQLDKKKILEQQKTIKEKENTIKEVENIIKEQEKTIEVQNLTIVRHEKTLKVINQQVQDYSELLKQKDIKIKEEQNLHNENYSKLSEKLSDAVKNLLMTQVDLQKLKKLSKECNSYTEILTKTSELTEQEIKELKAKNLVLLEIIDVKNVENLEMEKASAFELLTNPKVVDKTIWYIALPLNCLLAIMTIAVIVVYCRRNKDKKFTVEEIPFVGEEMSNMEKNDGKMRGYD